MTTVLYILAAWVGVNAFLVAAWVIAVSLFRRRNRDLEVPLGHRRLP